MTRDAGKEPMVRFSVAVGGELLERFDDYCREHRYANRSEAVRGLMRTALIEEVVARDDEAAMGVVTLIYDHHVSQIGDRLMEIQHESLGNVVSTTHVHLDQNRCLEVILVRGKAKDVRELADRLIGAKGIEMGKLVLAAAQAPDAMHGAEHGHEHGYEHHHGGHVHGVGHDHEHTHKESGSQAKKRKNG